MTQHDKDDSIHFTPDRGFNIEMGAEYLARLMKLRQSPLTIFVGDMEARFEPGCTACEIIDGYRQAVGEPRALSPARGPGPRQAGL